MQNWVVILLALSYLALLFSLAWYLDRRAKRKQTSRLNRWIYAMAIPVYCTAWTYYGSVGKAVNDGWEFLTIYLGPILTVPIWWIVVRKMIRISEVQRISTLPDFISSRYDKSLTLSIVSSVFIAIGIIPYISIQLKSISSSFDILIYGNHVLARSRSLITDSAFYIAIILAFFIILFVFRSIETTDKHHGMMGAIAVDSLVKLLAFLAVGVYVVYYLFDGFQDVFARMDLTQVSQFQEVPKTDGMHWFFLLLLSMSAIILLPRQFQVTVAENTSEDHLRTAIWAFPLYLLLINIFVVPIAIGGQSLLATDVDPDTFVLALPLYYGAEGLASIAFLGGFSASTGMIVVSTIALSLMVSNNVVVPIRLRRSPMRSQYPIQARQILVFTILGLAFLYYWFISDRFPLVSIGLISFAAMIQFAPAVLGALFWKDAHSRGVLYGLITGFIVWAYTLVVPTIVEVGLLPESLMTEGLFHWSFLKPQALFGLDLPQVSHGTFWSLFFNAAVFLGVSIFREQSAKERNMAEFYVNIYANAHRSEEKILWKGQLVYQDLLSACENILGKRRTREATEHYRNFYGEPLTAANQVEPRFVNYTERLLSGAIGSASARILISTIAKEEEIENEELVKMLRETNEISRLNTELRLQSNELQRKTLALQGANERLQNLDAEKDDFISTVTHELRTPLTSIKAFVEILQDNSEMEQAQQEEFLKITNDEIDRMTRLINEVLDIEKLESRDSTLHLEPVRPYDILEKTLESMQTLLEPKNIQVEHLGSVDHQKLRIMGNPDRLNQVFVNLISNAIKYSGEQKAWIHLIWERTDSTLKLGVADNGAGIDPNGIDRIFDKFFQVRDQTRKKPKGTGLGLSITQRIVQLHGGSIKVESELGKGTTFTLTFPIFQSQEKHTA